MKKESEGSGSQRPPDASGGPAAPELHILIVDDHSIVRDGLKQILSAKFPGALFEEARDGREALKHARTGRWDVILLDISLPDQSGLDVLQQVKALQPNTPVLILTMHPEDQYAMRVLKAGASGYLTKGTASADVVQAVAKVLAGGKYISAVLAEKLAGELHEPRPKAVHETLSNREFQIFRLIAMGKSSKEIAFEASLSIKTVSTYRTRMLKKLGFQTHADVIRYALREKLVE